MVYQSQIQEKFFTTELENKDKEIYSSIQKELTRQQNQIELIASENIVSKAVLQAMGSILTNKYAEGYSNARYYQGCKYIDEIETLCIERVKKLFNCKFANVQPHSGANANLAVFFALATAGDTILGMSLDAGGHLTHGAKPTISGKWFKSVQYGLTPDGYINYDEVEKLAKEHNPKIIVAGGSAYPREIEFEKFRKIADSVGAYLMVDMAHFAGLVAGGVCKSPLQYADVVTSTTHKTLRGPRGGIILTNNEEIAKKVDKAIFPGTQGGPLEHIIAGKAVAFGEALTDEYKEYALQVKKNAIAMGERLKSHGFDLVSNGTDTHLILVDLRKKGITGAEADLILEESGITCNKNGIPNDPNPPKITSGIRLGSPAGTTRGFKEKEFEYIADLINEAITGYVENKGNESAIQKIKESVKSKVVELCSKFPIYE